MLFTGVEDEAEDGLILVSVASFWSTAMGGGLWIAYELSFF